MYEKKCTVVAEIGCNHKGDFTIAKKMIETAALCGVDYVKFQKRCNKELLTQKEYDAPHPNGMHSYGKTYGEHREFLEFTVAQHEELKQHCQNTGVKYACSVWDVTSAAEIAALNPDYIKIPSAMNLCFELYECLLQEEICGFCTEAPEKKIIELCFRGDIHVSLGMTSQEEKDKIVEFLTNKNVLDRLVLYHCTSAYPAPFESLNLLEITRLREDYPSLSIGYSGHNYGIAVDVAVLTLGALWIERHFTLDRIWKGTDHAASLEPDGLRRVVRDVKAISKALTFKQQGILDVEVECRNKLKKGIVHEACP